MILIKICLSVFMLVSCSYKMFVASGSYCLFLMSLSITSSIIMYLTTKSFWYCCILLLVYMGGVYVLLLFVSIYSYKSHSYSSMMTALLMSTFFMLFFYMNFYKSVDLDLLNNFNFNTFNDESLKMLTKNKWMSYIFMLLSMLMSMIMFSFMFNDSSNYMR